MTEGFESNENPLTGNSDDGVARVTLQQSEDAPNRQMTSEEAQNRSKTDQELYSAKSMPQSTEVDQNVVQNQKEALLAGKFKNAEDLEKAYTELSKKLGTNEKNTDTKTSPEESQTLDSNVFSKATSEWETTGQITQETLTSLTEAGIPEEVVNQYIANANAQEELKRADILESIGGQNEFDKMSNWAQNNLPKDEIEGFNNVISTGDIGQIKLVLGALRSRMGAKTFIQPDGNSTSQGDRGAFKSKAEMTTAVNDPRYSKDTAYRNEVARKIMMSKNL
jgi:hypothetical protein|tara:strand:+ start:2271 stop:3107 length:837 start_codon:yes stop_codon:yes gene_type:complete